MPRSSRVQAIGSFTFNSRIITRKQKPRLVVIHVFFADTWPGPINLTTTNCAAKQNTDLHRLNDIMLRSCLSPRDFPCPIRCLGIVTNYGSFRRGQRYSGYWTGRPDNSNESHFAPTFAGELAFVGGSVLVGWHDPTFEGLALQEQLAAAKVSDRCGLLVIELSSGDVIECNHRATVIRAET